MINKPQKPIIEIGEKLRVNGTEIMCVEIQIDCAVFIDGNGDDYSIPFAEIERVKNEEASVKALHSSTIYMTNIAFLIKAITRKDKTGKSYLDLNETNNKQFKEAVMLFQQGSEILTKAIMKADYRFMVNEQEAKIKDIVKCFDFMAALTEAAMYVAGGREWEVFQNALAKTVNKHFGYQVLIEVPDEN